MLREVFNCPVFASSQTKELLREKNIHIDKILRDGDVIETDGNLFEAIFTPGHAPGHLCLLSRQSKLIIAGDMVAGESTIFIDPHEGDMNLYLNSLRRLHKINSHALCPAHGLPIVDASGKIDELICHRQRRENQILNVLNHAPQCLDDIISVVYSATPRQLWAFAKKQAESHLLKLFNEGKVEKISIGWMLKENH